MTIKLSVAQRLRVGHASAFSFTASGIDTTLTSVYFIIGAKRTTGAPTTVGDLTDHYTAQLTDMDQGSFVRGDTATVKALLRSFSVSSSMSSALAGDHMYLLVNEGSTPPDSGGTFVATKSLGVLAA